MSTTQTQSVATTKDPKEPKVPVLIGSRGIEVHSLDELYRFARYVSESGFAPKGMEAPETIVVAVQMGLEIGLTMMASVQNIAVINGRPAIYGDVPLAIARNSGLMEIFEEYFEQDGRKLDRAPVSLTDGTAAVCRLKRVNNAPHVQSFSVADAKRAGLWNKSGPWTQYPLRMLQMRARGFALRDQFGDALKGLITREEAMDLPADPVAKARNVTPREQQAPQSTAIQAPAAEREHDYIPGLEETANPKAPAPVVVVKPGDLTQAQAELSAILEGIPFDTFREWLLTVEKIKPDAICDDMSMVPTSVCEALIAQPRVINGAIKMMRGAK